MQNRIKGTLAAVAMTVLGFASGSAAEALETKYLSDGLDRKKWVVRDSTPVWEGQRLGANATASAPVVAGTWPEDDGMREMWKDRLLAVQFHCSRIRVDERPYSYLTATWFEDERSRTGGISLVHPKIDERALERSGWNVEAVWFVRIGGNGDWLASKWGTSALQRAYATIKGVRDIGGWMSTSERMFVLKLVGSDIPEFIGTEGSGLTKEEVRQLQGADALRFKVPYYYPHASGFKELKSEHGIPVPKTGEHEFIFGFNEWHVPLRGSRKAIDEALKVCSG